MPHFPTFSYRALAVDVEVGIGKTQRLFHPGHPEAAMFLLPQQVHHRRRAPKLNFPKREAADRPDVLLKLGDRAGLDAQEPRVVHPRRQLIHPELTSYLEHFHGQGAHQIHGLGQTTGDLQGAGVQERSDVGGAASTA